MLKADRQKNIFNLIKENRTIKITDLTKLLNVSASTIRRDLNELKENQPIELIHGGAMYTEDINSYMEEDFKYANKVLRKIGKKAFELINDKDIILIDAGRTTLELAKMISNNNVSNFITVITTNIAAAIIIGKNKSYLSTIMVGGEYRGFNCSLVGKIAEEQIMKIKVNKAFIGATGITQEGFYTSRPSEVSLRNAICKSSQEVILVADNTKFDNETGFLVNNLNHVDKIITNNISANWKEILKAKNIDLILI